jgi:hypothetical protein
MDRNRIGLIVGAVVVVLLLLWWFTAATDDAVETTEGADVEAPATE